MRTKMTLDEKRASYRTRLSEKQPDYKLVKFREERSEFKHTCGKRFEADNKTLLRGIAKCPCMHISPTKLSIEHLDRFFKQDDSKWNAIKYKESEDTATFKNKECGHIHKFSVANLKHIKKCRCPTCYPNKYASQYITHDQYVAKLGETRPDYKLLGKYVDSKTRTKYKHKTCGTVFEMQPSWFNRATTLCPGCKEH